MKPIFIGKYYEDGEKIFLGDDELQTHVHGIGASRTGKSKLIEWMSREFVRNRQGFCLIDPHGSLYDDLVTWLAYVRPKRDIILLEPASEGRVVGFNPFQHAGDADLSVLVDSRVQAIVKVWGAAGTDQTPLLERHLTNVIWALMEQGYSLDVARYFLSWQETEIREHLTRAIRSEIVRSEWKELSGARNADEFKKEIRSTQNRLLFRFLTAKAVRRTMGLNFNNIDIEDVVEKGKILLVNLQPKKNRLSYGSARLIGTLLLNDFWEFAKQREQGPGGKPRSHFHLIIDEFQEFLIPEIPTMLDQTAKRGIHLFLFHQRLDQLRNRDPDAFSAIMTNARIKAVFGGLSRDDAYTMVKEIFPGQIDLKRVKFLIEQTKFLPVYGRDKVYSKGTSRGTTDSSMTGVSHSAGLGDIWDPIREEWVPGSMATQSGESSATGSSESFVEQEGEADVPIFIPTPFKEISSITPYPLEETLWELSDQLMLQYQRDYMIRIPGELTKGAKTPFVTPRYVKPERIEGYKDCLLQNFLTPAEVDQALFEVHNQLSIKAKGHPLQADPHGEIVIPGLQTFPNENQTSDLFDDDEQFLD